MCLFCSIVAGDIPAEKIYEDEHTLAFLDIRPTNPGHVLVIPKKHAENVLSAESDTVAQVFETVRMLAPKVKEVMEADGINIYSNNGEAAGQVIFHMHIHIIPRFSDDGHKVWHGKDMSQEELHAIGEKLRTHIT
jgi:histidine triad (HIT) family protein